MLRIVRAAANCAVLAAGLAAAGCDGSTAPSRGEIVVESEVAGSRAAVDSSTSRPAPATFVGLMLGEHIVVVEAPGHATWEQTIALSEEEPRRVVRAAPTPLPARLTLRYAPEGVLLELRPEGGGEPVVVSCGEGTSIERDLVAGSYAWEASSVGHRTARGTLTAEPGGSPSLDVRLEALTGRLVVDSAPQGALVRVDGATVGNTPFSSDVAIGEREVALTVPGYVPLERSVTVAEGETADLGRVELVAMGRLDLSHVPADVRVVLGDEVIADGHQVAPGVVELRFEAGGVEPQTVTVEVAAGERVRVEAPELFTVGGVVSLLDLPKRVVLWLDLTRFGRYGRLAPGRYEGRLVRAGFRDHEVTFSVARAGEHTIEVPADAWEVEPEQILLDLDAWDAASSKQRRAAAERVDAALPDFALRELRVYEAGGVRHEVAVFDFDKFEGNFVLIPARRFVMGSTRDGSWRAGHIPHDVTLTKPFLIQQTELTQGDYFGNDGKLTDSFNLKLIEGPAVMGDPAPPLLDSARPMVYLTFEEFETFGRQVGLSLPTEAQWEFAARAGAPPERCWHGWDEDEVRRFAWLEESHEAIVQPVAQLRPSPFGLYDILGNAREVCVDVYAPYDPADAIDPVVSVGGDSRVWRVLRGLAIFRPPRAADCGRRKRVTGMDSSHTSVRLCRTIASW